MSAYRTAADNPDLIREQEETKRQNYAKRLDSYNEWWEENGFGAGLALLVLLGFIGSSSTIVVYHWAGAKWRDPATGCKDTILIVDGETKCPYPEQTGTHYDPRDKDKYDKLVCTCPRAKP